MNKNEKLLDKGIKINVFLLLVNNSENRIIEPSSNSSCGNLFTLYWGYYQNIVLKSIIWRIGWLVGFYSISTFEGYLIPNPFLYK